MGSLIYKVPGASRRMEEVLPALLPTCHAKAFNVPDEADCREMVLRMREVGLVPKDYTQAFISYPIPEVQAK